jgi:hypothetical protein
MNRFRRFVLDRLIRNFRLVRSESLEARFRNFRLVRTESLETRFRVVFEARIVLKDLGREGGPVRISGTYYNFFFMLKCFYPGYLVRRTHKPTLT